MVPALILLTLYQEGPSQGDKAPLQVGSCAGEVKPGDPLLSNYPTEPIAYQDRSWTRLFAADFDLDGDLDIFAMPNSNVGVLLRNDGHAGFSLHSDSFTFPDHSDVLIGDISGDQRPDVVTCGAFDGIHVRLGHQEQMLLPGKHLDARSAFITNIFLTNWDGVPGDEIIWSADDSDTLYCASLQGERWRVRSLAADWYSNGFELAAGDLNADGRPDLILMGTDRVQFQTPAGKVQEGPSVGEECTVSGAGDFDRDGRCDLLVACPAREACLILTLSAAGSWVERGSFPLYGHDADLQIADMNADGQPDLCVRQQGYYDMGCFGGKAGWKKPCNWQVLLRNQDGWTLRESPPVLDSVPYPGLVACLDEGALPDLLFRAPKGAGYLLVRDPLRP